MKRPKLATFTVSLIAGVNLFSFTTTTTRAFDRDRAVLEEHAIPHGPLPERHQTHAATVTEAADGTLVAAWFGGTAENHPDVAIWASRKARGASAWSEPVVVDDGRRAVGDGEIRDFSCWNPVLFTDPAEGTVYLYYKITGEGDKPGYKNWWGAVRTSDDSGRSWSDRVWLPEVPRTTGELGVFEPYLGRATGPVKNRPVILPDGSLLCGSSTESPAGWRVHFERYQAGDWTGAKFGVEIAGPLDGLEGIQPTFLVHSSDRQHLQVLSREDGSARSTDGGRTWSPIARSPLDTSKGLHAVSTAGGWHFVAFNPKGRSPLSLARSRDGETWETVLPDLRVEGDLKMDYPTVLQSADGKLHVVHSFGRDHINHLVLDTEYLSGEGG